MPKSLLDQGKRRAVPYSQPLFGHPALGKAFEETPPAFAGQRGYRGALVKLVLLCRELQRVWGNRPFPLDIRTAGNLIGVGRTTAGKHCRDSSSARIDPPGYFAITRRCRASRQQRSRGA